MQAKIELILLVTKLSDESCSSIMAKIKERLETSQMEQKSLLFNSKWEESKHPRDGNGQFRKTDSSKRTSTIDNPVSSRQRQSSDRNERRKRIQKMEDKLAERKNWLDFWRDRAKREKNLITRKLLERSNRKREDEIEKLKELIKTNKENHETETRRLADRFIRIDAEIERLSEIYADRGGDIEGLRFPDTPKGRKDKKKLEKLEALKAKLNKEIDWELEDE